LFPAHWTRIFVVGGLVLWALVFGFVIGVLPEGGTRLLSRPVFWVFACWGLVCLVLPPFAKFVVEVNGEGVSARMFPLWTMRARHRDIARIYTRKFDPLREYLGGGIRWTPWAGWAWIGNWTRRGVQLELRNGKRILIASRTPEKLEQALRAFQE
jgi:hypothetical protein